MMRPGAPQEVPTLADVVHRATAACDPQGSNPLVADLLARFEDANEPVTAVIYSHSHVDHFGGVRGVIDEADVKAGNVVIIAPDKFMEEVTKENILAGTPMLRRAMFQFGGLLPKGPRAQVDAGLGKVISRGTVTLIPPTQVIKQPIEVHTIDGVEMVFQLAKCSRQ